MRPAPLLALAALLAAIAAGCRGGTGAKAVPLPPPETFVWTGAQPVAFSPPPDGWERSRYQNGGAEGVEFVKSGSVGEQIFVAERFFLGNRDRCPQLRELLEGLCDYDKREFARAVEKARLHEKDPLSASERRAAPLANDALDRALEAFRGGDMSSAHWQLERAIEEAGSIRFTAGETVDRVLFTAERNSVYPALKVEPPAEGAVADVPAVIVAFTFEAHGETLLGRRIYFVENNRMFEIGYQGLAANLPLFERIVTSISLPPGPCEH